MRALPALCLAATLATLALPAEAAPVTENFTINVSGFIDVLGSTTPPVDPVSLTFSLRFDPATGDQFDETAGIRLLSSTLPAIGGLAFDYDSTNDILTIGGAGLGGIGITAGTNDVLADIDTPYTGVSTLSDFAYVTSGSTGIYEAAAGGVKVPEPGAISLMLTGLAMLAATRRRA